MMNKDNYIIRLEREEDYREVENLVREAFWNVYKPGCDEHYLLNQLRKHKDFVTELNFVMELDGKLIGQIAFVKACIESDDGRIIPTVTFGPISIAPKYQRQGYGKILLDYALDKAAACGFGAICIEGNIQFYSHSGFTHADEFGIRHYAVPAGEKADFFLCRELIPGYLRSVTGTYTDPDAYGIDAAKVNEFDKIFPPKEKRKLPGQIFE